jgi:Fe-S-cluster-containing dehydrogenase component/DMSO reductase anchor subunit
VTLFWSVDAVDDSGLDNHLAEQADLTAVERFAQRHATELVPRQARYYRDLLPTRPPGPGQQYAFDVNLDACTGCKACVAACHSLNGLDDGESWRSVTLLIGRTSGQPVQQTVTTACHHCVEPACLAGCPVDAYEKDPDTGIVVHLDDQCIGCSYCTLTCPYEVPIFNRTRGIVRKCDMCQGRLSNGEAPACVQACPNGAIAISVIDTADAISRAESSVVVPGGAPAMITVPTTAYRTVRSEVGELAGVASLPDGPAPTHWPLAVMLVLTQMAVGAFVTDVVVQVLPSWRGLTPPRSLDAVITAAAGTLAMAASALHLGRPLHCYRAVIGLRHSWLSREVVAFGLFNGLAVPYALMLLLRAGVANEVRPFLAGTSLAAGVAGVACSVLVYTTTRRPSWRPLKVTASFLSTGATCGLAAVLWATAVSSAVRHRPARVASVEVLLVVVTTVTLVAQATIFRPRLDGERRRRALLMAHDLRRWTAGRFGLGALGGIALPGAIALTGSDRPWPSAALATLALAGVDAGELAARSLFFTTAGPTR